MFKWNKMPVFYDGHDISSILNVTNLNRGIGTSRKNSLVKAGNQKGTQYKNFTYDEKIIPMSFSINGDLTAKRREIAKILNTNEPKRLIFGDEPDKYYLAVPDGNVDLDEAAQVGKGVINWIVPDGVAHSVDIQSYFSDLENPGQIAVFNNGTEDAKPLIKVRIMSENGYVGIVDGKGNIIQIGNADETDWVTEKRTEKVLWETMRTKGGWEFNKGTIVYPNFLNNPSTPNIVDGSWDFTTEYENAIPIISNPNKTVWNGPSLYQKIKPNSNGQNYGNFESRFRFNVGYSVKSVGRIQVQLNFGVQNAFAFILRDSSSLSSQMDFECWVHGEMISTHKVDMSKLNNGNFFEGSIVKYGDTVTFTLNRFLKWDAFNPETVIPAYSIKKSYTKSGLNTQKIDNVVQWMATNKKYPPVPTLRLTDTKFYWLNVPKTSNAPNTFDEGDELIIDTSKGEIYLNGVKRNDLNNIGNKWSSFSIPPGGSFIHTAESDWTAVKPVYEISFGEVWL